MEALPKVELHCFECSLASEYEALTRVFGFDESDWQRIYDNSLAARFQPDLRVALDSGKEVLQ